LRITKQDGCFVCVCGYQDREIPKMAGFRWNDPVPKAWGTRSARVAMLLSEHADETCKAELEGQHLSHKQAVDASWAGDSEYNPPAPEGMTYMPFQKAGIYYAISKLAPHLLKNKES